MRSKKKDKTKKYVAGGMFILPAAQAALGAYQMYQGQQMAKGLEQPSTEKPSEYADMLKLSRNRELEERRLDELNRNLATGIAAAQAGGGRALVGSLPGMVRAGDQGAIDLMSKRQADQMRALQIGAMGSERKISRDMNLFNTNMGAAQAAIEGGLQNIGGALGQAGMMAMYADKKKPKDDISLEEIQLQSDIDNASEKFPSSKRPSEFKLPMTGEELYRKSQGQIDLTDEQLRMLDSLEFAKGGKMTKGSFNHDTNPIDIVQKGVKVGEMTGGEVILNPKQQATLSKESAYFRKLLKKFNKNK
jgi:hypothetical protein